MNGSLVAGGGFGTYRIERPPADAEDGRATGSTRLLGLPAPSTSACPLGAIVVDDGVNALWVAVLEA
jgi:hypothetical protein